ncbi:MAG: ABC transporter permease [bacterium]|nr:MAG: ABC transporter permease [bacterium]
MAAWIILATTSILKIPERWVNFTLGLLPGALVPTALKVAGGQAERTALASGDIARVSLGAAFWVSLFAAAVIMLDAWHTGGLRRKLTLFSATLGIAVTVYLMVSGEMSHLSILREFINRRERFTGELMAHLALSSSAVGMAVLLGLPLGILAHRKARLRGGAFFVLNTLQTVPSLALFGILIPLLAALTSRFPVLGEAGIQGIGTAPALIALTVYSLLPVARNTFAGFSSVDPAAVDAGRGMGMTGSQLLVRVEFPIASPIILNGIRVALVQAIGLTAVAALIGAGGFGVFIFQGLGQAATDLVLLGAIPTNLIAAAADALLNGLIGVANPRGLR